MDWDSLTWPEMAWHGLKWPRMAWYSLAWLEMAWDDLIWPGMVKYDLAWPDRSYGLRWPDMDWYGLVWPDTPYGLTDLIGLTWQISRHVRPCHAIRCYQISKFLLHNKSSDEIFLVSQSEEFDKLFWYLLNWFPWETTNRIYQRKFKKNYVQYNVGNNLVT